MISFENISFSYPSKDLFKDISFKIEKGEFAFLIGESGTGKTTMTSFTHLGTLVYPVSTFNQGEFMSSLKRNDEGFTGLEAAIVLLSHSLVAAVFSYVVLGAGFFTTQKAQETVYKSVEQSTTNLLLIGNVYGLSNNTTAGINEVKFSIGLAPGAPPIDLTTMKIVFSTPDSGPVILAQGTTANGTVFTTKLNGATAVTAMSANDQVEVNFLVVPVSANTKMNIELRPSVGAALPFTKTAPATKPRGGNLVLNPGSTSRMFLLIKTKPFQPWQYQNQN